MSKKLTPTEREIVQGIQALVTASENFVCDWPHFIACIDLNHSYLDAKAIRFMNEVPSDIAFALNGLKKLQRKYPKEPIKL